MGPLGIRLDAASAVGLGAASQESPRLAGAAAAARQLQVEFLTQLLGVLRKTVPENDWLPKSPEREVFGGAFDRTVAEVLADQDALGMANAFANGGSAGGLKVPTKAAENSGGSPLQGGRNEDRR